MSRLMNECVFVWPLNVKWRRAFGYAEDLAYASVNKVLRLSGSGCLPGWGNLTGLFTLQG